MCYTFSESEQYNSYMVTTVRELPATILIGSGLDGLLTQPVERV